jgi:Isochorismatase family
MASKPKHPAGPPMMLGNMPRLSCYDGSSRGGKLMAVRRTKWRALTATLSGVFSMFLGLCAAAQDGHYGVDHDKWQVVYTTVPTVPIADTLLAIAPHGNDPVVVAAVDKFILGNKDTGLEKMLKDKGITSVITVGTAAHGAVLYTASAAALRGFNVIVPVDGMSGDGQNTFIEQYVAFNLTSAPVVSPKITLTRIDMIKF